MKLKIGKKVYLQKYDVGKMVHFYREFPEGMLGIIFGGDDDIFMMTENSPDLYDFSYVFSKPSHVEWLMEQEWLVDYCKYKTLPINDILSYIRELEDTKGEIVSKYNSESEEYKLAKSEEVTERLREIAHKILSLNIMISFRKGATRFRFPEEIEEWDGYSELEVNKEDEPKSWIRKIIDKLFFG